MLKLRKSVASYYENSTTSSVLLNKANITHDSIATYSVSCMNIQHTADSAQIMSSTCDFVQRQMGVVSMPPFLIFGSVPDTHEGLDLYAGVVE